MATANASKPMLNPLFVDVVVRKLFKYLPLNDVINQRRVCKLWQEIGLTRLKNDIGLIKISFGLETSIEKFLKLAEGFSFQFTNFAVTYWNDYANAKILNPNQTARLFEEYGTHMKVIELNLCGSTNSWTFLSDVLVNKAPHVERLRLESYQRWSETPGLFPGEKKPELKLKHLTLISENKTTESMYSKTLLAELFASSPCLESLTVAFDTENGMSISSHVKDVLQFLAEKGNISNLKELSLNVGDDKIFEILATSFKFAPLEKFSIETYQMDQPMLADINTFFGDHKDTLKNLSFIFPCVQFLRELMFPTMINLEALTIHDWCLNETHEDHVAFRIFDFGKQFPNLRTLNFYEDPSSDGHRFFNLYEIFPEETTPLPTLKNLELPPISMPGILRRMGRIFPNVLKLYLVPQTPDVLRELWTTWPEIKTLHISIMPYPSYRSTNLDSFFTGVGGGDHSRSFPSISNLKKLKHLRIDGYSYIPGSADVRDLNIKDEAARSALANMKELVLLHISRNRRQISPSCVQYLCRELGMLEIEAEAVYGALHLVKYEWQKRSRWPNLLDYE